ncbi:translocation protein SEC72 [Blastomyces parvus]|uniref:Translocation protein SEC72 n=1 Tax=Blastomyces parvus TaxID=2060905 RepID=A0A2B7WSM5_9EURO|nr:translocation protein SEC72 [Blastomyces parvus]
MFGSLKFPRVKMLLHAFQGFVVFLGWALTIAVFTQKGGTDGRTAYYFALCWITVPALIYLAAVPLWPRTRKFGNAYAFAVIDVLFGILWFASWVAVASYVAEGKKADDKDDKEKDKEGKTGCDAFRFGTAAKCNLSTGTVVLGVIVCLLFVITSYMSVRNLSEYRRSGTMPYEGSTDPSFAAHSKAAFSSNPAHDFDEEDDRDAEFRSGRRSTEAATGGPSSSLGYRRDQDDEYTLLHNSEADDIGGGPHGTAAPPPMYDPTRDHDGGVNSTPLPGASDAAGSTYLHDYDTSYTGAYGAGHQSQASGSFNDRYADR